MHRKVSCLRTSALLLLLIFPLPSIAKHKGFILIEGTKGSTHIFKKVVDAEKNPCGRPNGLYCTDDGWCLVAVFRGWYSPEEFRNELAPPVRECVLPYKKKHQYGRVSDEKWHQAIASHTYGIKFVVYPIADGGEHYFIWLKSWPVLCHRYENNSSLDPRMWAKAYLGYVFVWDDLGCDGYYRDYSFAFIRTNEGDDHHFWQFYFAGPHKWISDLPVRFNYTVPSYSTNSYVELWVK